MLGAGALGRPRGMEWGGRREEGSGWGTHVYLWQIHFDIWQNQYNIVKLKKKTKQKKRSAYYFYMITEAICIWTKIWQNYNHRGKLIWGLFPTSVTVSPSILLLIDSHYQERRHYQERWHITHINMHHIQMMIGVDHQKEMLIHSK